MTNPGISSSARGGDPNRRAVINPRDEPKALKMIRDFAYYSEPPQPLEKHLPNTGTIKFTINRRILDAYHVVWRHAAG